MTLSVGGLALLIFAAVAGAFVGIGLAFVMIGGAFVAWSVKIKAAVDAAKGSKA